MSSDVESHARMVWDNIPLVLPDETDPECERQVWHHTLLTAISIFGCQRVWSIGFEALGYPPTWVHTQPEAEKVNEALLQDARTRYAT